MSESAILDEIRRTREELKSTIEASEVRLAEEVNRKITSLENENQLLREKLEQHERKSRENNIIIFGLKHPVRNITADFIIGEMKNLIGVEIEESQLNNFYSLGKTDTCPIKVEFVSFLTKKNILANVGLLKGTEVNIANDSTSRQLTEELTFPEGTRGNSEQQNHSENLSPPSVDGLLPNLLVDEVESDTGTSKPRNLEETSKVETSKSKNAQFLENVEKLGMAIEEIYCCDIKKETYDEIDDAQYSENVEDLGIFEGNVEDVDISEQFIDESGVYDRNKYEAEHNSQNPKIHLNSRKNECDFSTDHEEVFKMHEGSNHPNPIDPERGSCDNVPSEISHPESHPASVNLKQHKCHLCEYAANQKTNLKNHIDSIHLNLKQNKCHLCEFATNYKYYLKLHIRKNHKKRFKCHLCDYAPFNKHNLERHVDSFHLNLKKYKCPLCEYAAKTIYRLKAHEEAVHLKPNKCPMCKFHSMQKDHLKQHIESAHLHSKYQCDICHFATNQRNLLRKHISSVHVKLKNTSENFSPRRSSVDGLSPNLLVDEVQRDTGTSKSRTPEEKNAQYLENVEDLGIFEGNVEDVDISEQFIVESGVSDRKEYEAEPNSEKNPKIHLDSRKYEGDFTTDHEEVSKRHEDSNHPNPIEPGRFQCHLCDYAPFTKNTLKRHIDAVHLNLKKYKCHLCDYTTTHKNRLKLHIDKNHKKRFKCHLCDYAPFYKHHLKRHINSVHLKLKNTSENSSPRRSSVDGLSPNLLVDEVQRDTGTSKSRTPEEKNAQYLENVEDLGIFEGNVEDVDISEQFIDESGVSDRNEYEAEPNSKKNPKIHLDSRKYEGDFTTDHEEVSKRHEDSNHPNPIDPGRFQCHLCDYAPFTKNILKQHIDAVHLNLKKYKCHLCDYTANHITSLKYHIGKNHKKRFKCHLCDYAPFNKHHLKRHINSVHLKLKNTSENFSPRRSSVDGLSPNLLVDEVQKDTGTSKSRTPEEKNAQYLENVEDLGIFEGNVEDVDISEQFIDESGVSDRKEYEAEPNSEKNPKIHLDSRKYEGDFTTDHEEVSKRHEDSNHPNPIDPKRFQCHLCDYAPFTKNFLKDHIDAVHLNLKKYKCHLCDYTANHKTSLKLHIGKNHKKRFKCHLCDYAPFKKHSLKCHIDSVHLNLKKYKCHLCEYAAKSSYRLKEHKESVHSNQYKCPMCKFYSMQKDHLKQHIESAHLYSKYQCDKCHYATNQRSLLRKHISSVHVKLK